VLRQLVTQSDKTLPQFEHSHLNARRSQKACHAPSCDRQT